MLHFYSNNIYRVSFYSLPCLLITLLIVTGIIVTFTLIGLQTPEMISFNVMIDEYGCQNQLNTLSFVNGQQQLFSDIVANNLICFFCLNTYSIQKPYGIHAIISGNLTMGQQMPNRSNIIYSIGNVVHPISSSCWFNAQSSTDLQSFPEIISTNNGHNLEIQPLQQDLVEWSCVSNNKKWACKSDEVLFQNAGNFAQLYGFFKVLGTQIQDMQFGMIQYQEKYFQFNEVMYLVWIGFELVFGCLLMVIQDEFQHQRKLVFIPTMGYRNSIFGLFVLNNHPLFIIQLFHDNIYVKMINVMFMCIAQGGFLFYCINTTQRIYYKLEPKLWLKVGNLLFCLVLQFLKAFIGINQALQLLEQLPSEVFFIEGSKISYFSLLALLWLCYFCIYQVLLFRKLRKEKIQEIYLSDSDKQLKLIFKFYKGLTLFQGYITLFIVAYFVRIIWQFMIYFNPNSLYYDHYQTTLWNSFVVILFWWFDLHNPENVQELLDEDEEEISVEKQIDMINIKPRKQQYLERQDEEVNQLGDEEVRNINQEQQEQQEQLQLQKEQEQERQIQNQQEQRLDTKIRLQTYSEIPQPDTNLR